MRRNIGLALALVLVGCRETALIYSTSCEPIKSVRVPCSELPSLAEVNKGLAQHADVVQKIKDVNSGRILVEPRPVKECSGRAVIYIDHASVEECNQIKDIINSKDFFGIPYELYNS